MAATGDWGPPAGDDLGPVSGHLPKGWWDVFEDMATQGSVSLTWDQGTQTWICWWQNAMGAFGGTAGGVRSAIQSCLDKAGVPWPSL